MFIQQDLQTKTTQDLPLFIQWMDFLKWLMLTTEGFPKKVRFTLSDRMNVLALNTIEDLVEARYRSDKSQALKRVNLSLEKLRVLFRICFETQILSHDAYEHSVLTLNQMGKQLGGWMKQQQQKSYENM